ncbi:MAG TPA: SigB/SigF/SigG family RNA polymerase sigma factor [Rugosimonospora sp.]|nr:SigB/SigF/SigG family RNA polymerase sigma factor [Rugosimonospora sp.]
MNHTTSRGAGTARLDDTRPAPGATEPRPAPERDGDEDWRDDLDALVNGEFRRRVSLRADDPERARIRNAIICAGLPLARRTAQRFRSRGEPLDDLVQVATVGLIKSVDRFDVDRGVPFSHYAGPTIQGELKRHFRDKGWSVRVTRRMQELHLEITHAVPQLSQDLGASPTVAQLAAHLGAEEDDVIAGLECGAAYRTRSLSSPVHTDDFGSTELGEVIGSEDAALESIADREALHQVLGELPEREQRIVSLRFFGNLTQSQIAQRVGISQMHVSRLLTQSLALLRERLLAEPG